jgi:hypothetical protein
MSRHLYWKVIPIRGGELIAISVFEVLEFFFNSQLPVLAARRSIRILSWDGRLSTIPPVLL